MKKTANLKFKYAAHFISFPPYIKASNKKYFHLSKHFQQWGVMNVMNSYYASNFIKGMEDLIKAELKGYKFSYVVRKSNYSVLVL